MSELMSAEQLRAQHPVVVDVRAPDEYAAGHVTGAINIPAGELSERYAEIPNDRPVVTYCNMQHPGTSRGERSAELLRSHGYQAYALEGGFPAWRTAGLPVSTGPQQASRED